MGSTLSVGRAQCKPADRFDRYGALRQVEKLQAQARGGTTACPLRRPATHSLTTAEALVALAAARAVGAAQAA
jgi:hypothetical protein